MVPSPVGRRLYRATVAVILGAGTSSPAIAQIIASERGSVSQIIDGTRIAVEFARPRLRGRDSVFGKLEPWNRAWTPGADSANGVEYVRFKKQPDP